MYLTIRSSSIQIYLHVCFTSVTHDTQLTVCSLETDYSYSIFFFVIKRLKITSISKSLSVDTLKNSPIKETA